MTDPWRTGLGAAMGGGASMLGLDTLRGDGLDASVGVVYPSLTWEAHLRPNGKKRRYVTWHLGTQNIGAGTGERTEVAA